MALSMLPAVRCRELFEPARLAGQGRTDQEGLQKVVRVPLFDRELIRMQRIILLVGMGLMFGTAGSSLAQSFRSPILDGIVTSSAEGSMEGVLVSAKRVGGTITVTGVTDEQGRFSFPAHRPTSCE